MLNGVTLILSEERMVMPVAMTSASEKNILPLATIRKKGRIPGNAFLTNGRICLSNIVVCLIASSAKPF